MARKSPPSNLPSRKAGESGVTSKKARQILSDGETRGNPLTQAQRGLFGAIAGGAGQPRANAPGRRTGAIGERPIPARTQARMSAVARAAKRSR